MAVEAIGNKAAMYIQQSNQTARRSNQLDEARIQNQSKSLEKAVDQMFALRAQQSENLNKVKEAALNTQQGRIDTWA